jgi:UDP-N-acetylmuramyl pentapeptide phosphotransferase/UDP-N-acetylglucosamine-1-phosphate transferase
MKDVSATWTIFFLAVAFGMSWIGVALFRRWSLGRELLDIPNERSSHAAPVPRGGGLIIVLVCLLGYVLIAGAFGVPFSPGYFFGALMVSIVSWLDDLYSLAFWKRLIVHFAAAAILVADLGIWHELSVPLSATQLSLGPILGTMITVAWVVWLLNAYNFMDGIDGIASLQAVVAGVGWAALGLVLNIPGLLLFAGLFSVASLGFLLHNWPPAKIFMGDVGSAFLGFTLAAMPLLARGEAKLDLTILPLAAVAFVWLFVFDTIFTLIRRLVNRERIWEAHRGHIYQRMLVAGHSHRSVTLAYGAGAALLMGCTVLALTFAGNLTVLTVFLLLVLTLSQIYIALRKKR